MRYREGQNPDPANPYTEGMHTMLSVSVFLALLIGIALLILGVRGRKIWLASWSAGLILCSVLYLMLGDSFF